MHEAKVEKLEQPADKRRHSMQKVVVDGLIAAGVLVGAAALAGPAVAAAYPGFIMTTTVL